MSSVGEGDRPLHYSDGSHRWICPDPDGDQDGWTELVRAHQEVHRSAEVLGAELARPAPRPPQSQW